MAATHKALAKRYGAEAGRGAGSWVVDGNTTRETAERLLAGIADCDPEVMEMQPSPLSGEWAGESIPELSAEYGIPLDNDDIADAFVEAYSRAYWDTVETAARAVLDGDES